MFSFFKRSYKTKVAFDKVYCVSYCRNIKRQNNIIKIMNYLGIDFEFIYGADYTNLEILKHPDCKFINDDYFEPLLKKRNFHNYTHYIGVSYDHYTAVINAYESGANSVLIMEDDGTFISDKDYILHSLNNYPEDAEVIKYGYVYTKYIRDNFPNINLNVKGKYILESELNWVGFGGCQLYALCNREVMKKYIEYQQNHFETCTDVYPKIATKIYGIIMPLALDADAIRMVPEDINKYKLIEQI